MLHITSLSSSSVSEQWIVGYAFTNNTKPTGLNLLVKYQRNGSLQRLESDKQLLPGCIALQYNGIVMYCGGLDQHLERQEQTKLGNKFPNSILCWFTMRVCDLKNGHSANASAL
jgi:hypothetical protein